MMTLEQIRLRMDVANLTKLAEAAKVPYPKLYRLARGHGGADYDLVKTLSDYFEGLDNASN